MALFPIELPAGVYRNGTMLQSQGRYYDADLVRWTEGTLRPVGGWRERGDAPVGGRARCMQIWRDNDGVAWVAIGTHTGLYVMDRAGTVHNVTPAGFSAGEADSTFRGGYGNWLYGRGAYGTARPETQTPTELTVWSLDTWGEDLVGCTPDDGVIYEWAGNTAAPAVAIGNAPSARAVHVTANRIMMALGANGNPRRVAWCDQEANTVWTPTVSNYAGDFDLQTPGRLMCGRRVTGGSLLLTDVDAHLAKYLGQPLVYGFDRKGTGCGIVSQNAVAVVDGRAYWMSQRGFFMYDNWVKPLPCDVADYVFSDVNRSQLQKATAWHNSDHGEIWWFYPSKSSLENDRYVAFSYREGHWAIGKSMGRLCGAERGALPLPLTVDADGVIYEQEVGLDHGGAAPYAETGPFLVGEGDRVVSVREIRPDEKTVGDVTASFYLRDQATGAETLKGPYELDDRVPVRFTGRMMRVRFTGARLADFRVGNFKLDGVPGGLR